MAKRIRAKLVLELLAKGMSGREIRSTRRISQRGIKLVRDAAERAGIIWDDVADMPDGEVYDLLFPAQKVAREAYAEPDWEWVHSELQRDGVTLKLLWEELRDEAARDGLVAKSYNTFCRGYQSWVTARGVTNRLEHKPGQVMEVDWSGTPMWLVDPNKGEATRCHLFVETLPYSQYSYVEATLDMRQNTWLACHVHAWDFFGGAAVRTVCDNLKTGVISYPHEGEVVLNEAYEALGAHYMSAIMPTGVRKPKQKASVEGTCGKVATAVVARLRNHSFATLAELNAAVREMLDAFNAVPFQKREGSRREVFEEVERAFLAPLPKVPFEVCDWVRGRRVAPDFHVTFERNRYSVPYVHVGASVDLKVSAATVEVWVAGERVATHQRFSPYEHWCYRTDESHMPPEFAKAPEWDDSRILRWAREVGPNTHLVVSRIFSDVQIKEQGYNPALAVLNLSKRYGEEALEGACGYALEKAEHPRCRFIRSALASGVAATGDGESDATGGGYIRGAGYYGGGDR